MCEAKAADPAASSCNTPVDVWGNHQCNCTIDLSLFCTATKKHPIYDKHTPSTSEPERPCTLHCLAIPCLSLDLQDHKQPGLDHGWQLAHIPRSRRGPAHCTAWPCLSPDLQDLKQPGLVLGWQSSHKRTYLRVEEALHVALPGHAMPHTRFTRSQATQFGSWLAASSYTSESERPCTLHCLAMPLTRFTRSQATQFG